MLFVCNVCGQAVVNTGSTKQACTFFFFEVFFEERGSSRAAEGSSAAAVTKQQNVVWMFGACAFLLLCWCAFFFFSLCISLLCFWLQEMSCWSRIMGFGLKVERQALFLTGSVLGGR